MSNPNVVTTASTSTPSTEVAGQEIVVSFGDIPSEYAALRSGAIVIDRSARGRMRFHGEKAGEALTGLVTNDVLSIAHGHGQYGAALSAKGRIVADLRMFAGAGGYLVDTPPRAWPGFVSMVKKYVNPRLAGYRDDSHAIRDIGVFGVEARRIVGRIAHVHADTLASLPVYGHAEATVAGATITIMRSPDIGLEGYELFVPFESYQAVWDAVVQAGATPAGLGAWEIARVEAGRPEWGIDIDDSTIPQEANFDDFNAISYTKGCYIGQEVVARVHFRGHVNRHLRGLRAASTEAPPTGAQLIDDSGNHVGDVRSSVASPRFGGIAIAMIRREIVAGTSLNAKWETGEQRVDTAPLPFSA